MEQIILLAVFALAATVVVGFLFFSSKKDTVSTSASLPSKTTKLNVKSSRGVKHYHVSLRNGRSGKYREDYDYYDESGDLIAFTDPLIDILFDNLFSEEDIEYIDPNDPGEDLETYTEDEYIEEEVVEEVFEAGDKVELYVHNQSAHLDEEMTRHFAPQVDHEEVVVETEEPVYEAPEPVYEAPEPSCSSSSSDSDYGSDDSGSDD